MIDYLGMGMYSSAKLVYGVYLDQDEADEHYDEIIEDAEPSIVSERTGVEGQLGAILTIGGGKYSHSARDGLSFKVARGAEMIQLPSANPLTDEEASKLIDFAKSLGVAEPKIGWYLASLYF